MTPARRRRAAGPGRHGRDLGQDPLRAGRLVTAGAGAARGHRRVGAGGGGQRGPRRRPRRRAGPGGRLDLLLAGDPRLVGRDAGRGRPRVRDRAPWPVRTPRSPSARAARPGGPRVVERAAGRRSGGSDQQLVAFRLLVRSTDDVRRLRDWAAGERLPTGIAPDPELALADRGAAGRARPRPRPDRGGAGPGPERGGPDPRHPGPDATLGRPEAKASAWARLVEPSDLTAYELYATAEGFFVLRPGGADRPLRRPLLRRDRRHRGVPERLGAARTSRPRRTRVWRRRRRRCGRPSRRWPATCPVRSAAPCWTAPTSCRGRSAR